MRTGPFSPAACAQAVVATGVAANNMPSAKSPDVRDFMARIPPIFLLPGDCSVAADASTSNQGKTMPQEFYEQVQHRIGRDFGRHGDLRERLPWMGGSRPPMVRMFISLSRNKSRPACRSAR